MSEIKTFLEQRKQSLGGTDIAALCGVNPYKDAFDVFQDKVNNVKVEQNTAMRLGNAFEPGIAELFSEDVNLPLFSPTEHRDYLKEIIKDNNVEYIDVNQNGKIYLMLRRGIAHGSLDYFTIDHDGNPAVVECKLVTNNFFKSKEEFIRTNPHYYMQTQWYMYVTGFRTAYFATVQFKFGGHIEWYKLDYNEEVIDKALSFAEKFWEEHIKTGKSPLPSNPDQLNQHIDFIVDDDYAIANDEIFQVYTELTELKERLKVDDKRKKELEDKIIMAIYNKEGMKSKDNFIIATYKVRNRTNFDTKKIKEELPEIFNKYSKQSQSRVLIIKKQKTTPQTIITSIPKHLVI